MTQNTGKKCSENASKKVQKLKIFYPGEGGTPSPLPLEPHPPQTRPFGTRRDPAPLGKKLVAPLVGTYLMTKQILYA